MKATWGQVNGEARQIFKDPLTDKGEKKSAKGLIRVERSNDGFTMFDQQTRDQENQGVLETVFEDGKLVKETNLDQIRERLSNVCLLYTSPSPRDRQKSRMPSSA